MPRRFGRYEVQREIGEGAMGRVYRCVDPLMKRVVAVKTVKKEFLTRDTRDEYLHRFRREAQAAGGLSHPSIVSIFDVGEDYFVMEYLEGATLQVILRERGQIPVEEALRILGPLAEALDYAHRSGIVHRDIKPGNVLVLADGRPKLMDFGVAHLESSVMTAQGHFFGSPSYMAPEQVSGGEVSAAADLFSLAVVAYEMITGHRPFEGASITAIIYRVVNEDPPAPRQWDFALPPVFDHIFARALHKRPDRRFPDATSLVRALERREFIAEAATAAVSGAAFSSTVAATSRRTVATPSFGLSPVPPALLGSVETHDLQSAADAAAAGGRAYRRRTWLAVGGAMAATAVLALYLGQRAQPVEAPAPIRMGPGILRIETQPPGATVWLDGAERGTAPVALARVMPGPHVVRVSADGYSPAKLALTIKGGELPPPLRFVMDPLTATLRVRSEPADALVRLDGQPVGTTPLESMNLGPGRHEVRLERRGYTPVQQVVEGRAGETVEVALRLERERRLSAPPWTIVAAPPSPLPPHVFTEGQLVPLDQTDVRPRRISGEAASYPEEARRLHLLGSVTVDFTVDEKGLPQDLHVVESAGEVLDRAVVEAVRRWRYEPARKNGVKVKVRIQARHTFAEPG